MAGVSIIASADTGDVVDSSQLKWTAEMLPADLLNLQADCAGEMAIRCGVMARKAANKPGLADG